MYEALTILIRYIMIATGTYFVSTGDMDESMVEPLVGIGLSIFAVGWMTIHRFIKTKTVPAETEVIQEATVIKTETDTVVIEEK